LVYIIYSKQSIKQFPRYVVIEESNGALHTSIPGMLLSHKRLMTYIYPLLLQYYRQRKYLMLTAGDSTKDGRNRNVWDTS
jgi:hypothetical protein